MDPARPAGGPVADPSRRRLLDLLRKALASPRPRRHRRSSSATDSTWYVCGNMSTTAARRTR
jgi:hypothetical protein